MKTVIVFLLLALAGIAQAPNQYTIDNSGLIFSEWGPNGAPLRGAIIGLGPRTAGAATVVRKRNAPKLAPSPLRRKGPWMPAKKRSETPQLVRHPQRIP